MFDLAALPDWLPGRRWFGGKGAKITSAEVIDEARLGGLNVATIEVSYAADRRPERYLLPLRSDGTPLEDARDDSTGRTRRSRRCRRGPRSAGSRRSRATPPWSSARL